MSFDACNVELVLSVALLLVLIIFNYLHDARMTRQLEQARQERDNMERRLLLELKRIELLGIVFGREAVKEICDRISNEQQ